MSETGDEADQGKADELELGGSNDSAIPEVDLAALAAAEGDDAESEEDALDLDDLDQLGVDGVVARLRTPGGNDAEDMAALDRAKPRRSPIISMVVVAFGAYLLVTMFPDFRYWLRSSEPVELGHASSLLQDGRNLEAYDNQYVVLEGTPDVQHAVRMTTNERYIGYLRVMEGEGGLFAKVPRPKDQPVYDAFAGRYQGRLSRLGDDRAFAWLQEFYANQQVSRVVDLDVEAARSTLGPGALPGADGKPVSVGASEMLRMVFAGPDARVQLDQAAFPSAEKAEQAVAALGYPYLALPLVERKADSKALLGGNIHRFIARIPQQDREAAQAKLVAAAETTGDKVGAFVLALPATYSAPAGEITLEGDTIVFPLGDNATSPGYDVVDGKLVERSRTVQLRVPAAQLSALRLERTIEVDPNGFVVSAGEPPGEQWLPAMLWLLVLVISGANIASLLLWWRRRPA
ncbi:MAG: hypothetical protein K0V04_44080 [Deltaproteobacteria bacterium]|nr:hypothetical protein [Deltaproteobacteria bacterium]